MVEALLSTIGCGTTLQKTRQCEKDDQINVQVR